MKYQLLLAVVMILLGINSANSEQLVLQEGLDGYSGTEGRILWNAMYGDSAKPWSYLKGNNTFKEDAQYFTLTDLSC